MTEKQDALRDQPLTGARETATDDIDIPTPPQDPRGAAQMEAGAEPGNRSLLARIHTATPQYRKSLFRR